MAEDRHRDESDARPTPRPKTALSRRKFLGTTAATAGATAAFTLAGGTGVGTAKGAAAAGACKVSGANVVDTEPDAEPNMELNGGMVSPGNFDRPGHPPREAYRSLAETERKYRHLFQQDGGGQTRPKPQFSKTVHAVDDLGADPSGSEPANSALESGAEEGTLIVLPRDGKFLLDDDLNFGMDGGTFGLVGEGYEQVSGPPKKNAGPRFVAAPNTQARIATGAVTSGLFANFVLDQTNNKAGASIWAEAEQFCFVRDIRLVGVQDNVGSTSIDNENHPGVAMSARNENATVRVQRYAGENNNVPTMKNKGAVPHFWVGSDSKGVAEIVQCSCQDAANGIYGSRTPGDVHVIDGAYINNSVSQIRIAGKGSWVKGATMMIDAENFTGPRPDDFDTTISTNGFKHEMPSHIHKPGGGALQNCEIVAKSANRFGGLIFVRGHGGALDVINCRVVNNVGDSSLVASTPGSSYDPATKPPHDISIDQCTFTGKRDSPVIDIQGRPNSTVANTCIQMQGATESDIQGASTKNVTYGPNCQDTGASGAVGSAVSAAQSAYQGAASFVQQQVQQFFNGAAAIATVPFVVLIMVGIIALVFSSSLIAALAFAGGAIKLFSKKR